MTRREQYMMRRAKFMKRRDRARDASYVWADHPTIPGARVRVGKRHRWFHTFKQMPLRVWNGSYDYPDANPNVGGPATWTFHPIGPEMPPHVTFTGMWRVIVDNATYHFRRAAIGVHSRRVFVWPHKQGRRNGRGRKILGASAFAYANGYFPDWDPLGRSPTQAEVANGAPPVDTFPYSPRG